MITLYNFFDIFNGLYSREEIPKKTLEQKIEGIEDVWAELVGWDLTICSHKSTGKSAIYIKNGCNTIFYIEHQILLYAKEDVYNGIKNRLGIDNKECSNYIRAILSGYFSLKISNESIGVFKD